MSITEYRETYERFRMILGPTAARQIVDELDEERTAALAEEARKVAEEARIRAIIRQELGLD